MLTHGVLSDSMQTYEYMVPVSEEPDHVTDLALIWWLSCLYHVVDHTLIT